MRAREVAAWTVLGLAFASPILAIAVGLVMAVGCEHKVTEYPRQPEMTQGPTRDRVIIYPNWVVDVDAIARACGRQHLTYGCAVPGDLGPANWKCDIYIQGPIDFNDVPKLAVLGHEVLHCFGAKHKEM